MFKTTFGVMTFKLTEILLKLNRPDKLQFREDIEPTKGEGVKRIINSWKEFTLITQI